MPKNINPKLVVFDFDGVLTDNRVLVSESGEESVFCHRGDGLGFNMLNMAQIPTLILSKEPNPVVSARAKKLKIPCLQNIEDKVSALVKYCDSNNFLLKDVLYIGNDLNDFLVMKQVGYTACPSDAHPRIKAISKIKLKAKGGYGVAREIVEKHLGLDYIELIKKR